MDGGVVLVEVGREARRYATGDEGGGEVGEGGSVSDGEGVIGVCNRGEGGGRWTERCA